MDRYASMNPLEAWIGISQLAPALSQSDVSERAFFGTSILGTRASLMLDVVFLAMLVVVPTMLFGIRQAQRHDYSRHKRVMTLLTVVLAATVVTFEIDVRFFHPWLELAKASPYYGEPWATSIVGISLIVHLTFSISTTVLWIVVFARAIRRFDSPPTPGGHSASHVRLAKLTALDMIATAITGWIFYYLAFIATA